MAFFAFLHSTICHRVSLRRSTQAVTMPKYRPISQRSRIPDAAATVSDARGTGTTARGKLTTVMGMIADASGRLPLAVVPVALAFVPVALTLVPVPLEFVPFADAWANGPLSKRLISQAC